MKEEEKLSSTLQYSNQTDRTFHAFILGGPNEIAKKAWLIEHTQQWMHTNQPFHHPDFLQIGEDVSVDQIRKVLEQVHLQPFGACRVIYFDPTSQLSVLVQNMLLKTLEEPPANNVFIFSVASNDLLLDTIQSRCLSIYFYFHETEGLNQAIDQAKLSEVYYHFLAIADIYTLLSLMQYIQQEDIRWSDFQTSIIEGVRQVYQCKIGLANQSELVHPLIQKAADKRSLIQLTQAVDIINGASKWYQHHAQMKLVTECILFQLMEVFA